MPRASGVESTLQHFVGRDDDLRALSRFSLYKVMLYRTNLYTHAHRTAALVRAINPTAAAVFGPSYDPRKAETLAFIHDDAELVFGDVQAGNKSKMTAEQLEAVRLAEMRAIQDITKRFPQRIGRYTYGTLLQDAADHASLEAQVMCYADKYDALGEALHEVYAGNHHFTTNVTNQYGRIPTPPEYYADYFERFAAKYPDMRPLFQTSLPMFQPVPWVNYSQIVSRYGPHTLQNLQVPTGNLHYDTWRHVVLSDTNNEVRRDLYVQKEFLESS
ncbi:MAG TPA: YfbR-like 5'-deoxynucleotidase [Candidatus Saccharimonadales bacterium]|nr:YfbR-like 5'-deoxynucleotidase [Candidatus Saccharimonadales bacterium]